MKKGKYAVLLLVILVISSTIVACSDEVEVYNMIDNTKNPSVEACKAWNDSYIVANGDMMDAPPDGMVMPEGMTPPADVTIE